MYSPQFSVQQQPDCYCCGIATGSNIATAFRHKDELFTSDSIARNFPKLLVIKEMTHTMDSIRALRTSLASVLRRCLTEYDSNDDDDDDDGGMMLFKYDIHFENHWEAAGYEVLPYIEQKSSIELRRERKRIGKAMEEVVPAGLQLLATTASLSSQSSELGSKVACLSSDPASQPTTASKAKLPSLEAGEVSEKGGSVRGNMTDANPFCGVYYESALCKYSAIYHDPDRDYPLGTYLLACDAALAVDTALRLVQPPSGGGESDLVRLARGVDVMQWPEDELATFRNPSAYLKARDSEVAR